MTRTHLLLVSAAALAAVALLVPSSHQTGAPPPPAALKPALVSSSGPLTVAATLSGERVRAGDSDVYVRVEVSAPSSGDAPRQPLNLAIAIDQSGSMQGPKIEQARAAASALIDQLQQGDRLAIVAFSSSVNIFPSTRVDSDSLPRMRAFVAQLFADGGTNISEALDAARNELKRSEAAGLARIVLLSDGQPTAGDTFTPRLVARVDAYRAEGISTSAFGVGNDFNASLMQDLANHGAGSYAYIQNYGNMGLALANELRDASRTVARQVSLQLSLPAGVTFAGAPGRVFDVSGSTADVPLYDFAPGQTAQVLLRLRVSGALDGSDVKLGELSVVCVDVQHDRALRSSPLPLAAKATDNADELAAYQHADVVELSRKADLNVRLAEAEKAYESGDSTRALGLLGNIRTLFGASADALAGDDLGAVQNNWRKGGDDGARASKELTLKTMKNFGQNNASQY
jgi:Ca-activated chloride channel family protein